MGTSLALRSTGLNGPVRIETRGRRYCLGFPAAGVCEHAEKPHLLSVCASERLGLGDIPRVNHVLYAGQQSLEVGTDVCG